LARPQTHNRLEGTFFEFFAIFFPFLSRSFSEFFCRPEVCVLGPRVPPFPRFVGLIPLFDTDTPCLIGPFLVKLSCWHYPTSARLLNRHGPSGQLNVPPAAFFFPSQPSPFSEKSPTWFPPPRRKIAARRTTTESVSPPQVFALLHQLRP